MKKMRKSNIIMINIFKKLKKIKFWKKIKVFSQSTVRVVRTHPFLCICLLKIHYEAPKSVYFPATPNSYSYCPCYAWIKLGHGDVFQGCVPPPRSSYPSPSPSPVWSHNPILNHGPAAQPGSPWSSPDLFLPICASLCPVRRTLEPPPYPPFYRPPSPLSQPPIQDVFLYIIETCRPYFRVRTTDVLL